jgi:hypothetical protein
MEVAIKCPGLANSGSKFFPFKTSVRSPHCNLLAGFTVSTGQGVRIVHDEARGFSKLFETWIERMQKGRPSIIPLPDNDTLHVTGPANPKEIEFETSSSRPGLFAADTLASSVRWIMEKVAKSDEPDDTDIFSRGVCGHICLDIFKVRPRKGHMAVSEEMLVKVALWGGVAGKT